MDSRLDAVNMNITIHAELGWGSQGLIQGGLVEGQGLAGVLGSWMGRRLAVDIQSCVDFAKAYPVCYVATAQEGRPHVRALALWFADESGFYFQTGSMKSLCRELGSHPWVECCFYDNGTPVGTMLRVEGQVEFLEDMHLKERVLADRPFLRQFGLTAMSRELCLFRVPHGRAHFWTMENNLKPKQYVLF